MVKAFHPHEKELIRQQLLEQGREMFGSYGVAKTNIRDLTRAAGISQGAFYRFFGSKEELYFAILQEEEQVLKERLLAEVLEAGLSGKEMFKRFLLHGLELVHQHPIIRRMFLENEHELILRKLPPEVVEAHIAADEDALAPLIRSWQAAGLLVDVRAEVIVGVTRAFFLTSLHRKEIGADVFTETLELLADCLASGLTTDLTTRGGEAE
ncbi:TetR/AcrR family transcriptional regulator [Tumebacillus lipolyticus]|uniref:TetR/AcrR family transcriptional regulator n=1 Tax=Tumebacillus lipolyticus TaxID=1280370 RepID=A0ABW4ZV44_9BACL